MGKRKERSKITATKNKIKFFHKHVVEGKQINQCAEEMNMARQTLTNYKKSNDFRTMAIEHLESSKLNGIKGTVSKLVKALDAKKPIVTESPDGQTRITRVDDNKTQLQALQEVIKIYGLHAPIKKDVTATVSISSDEDLFRQIDDAQRDCRYVESYEKGKDGFEVAAGPQRTDLGSRESRKRVLLQDGPVPKTE